MSLNRRGLGTGLLWMRIIPAALLLVMVGAGLLALTSRTTSKSAAAAPLLSPAATIATPPSAASYSHIPMIFEPNQGQTDPRVRFMARGNG